MGREKLAEARALGLAGDWSTSAPIGEDVLAMARELDVPALIADAALQLGARRKHRVLRRRPQDRNALAVREGSLAEQALTEYRSEARPREARIAAIEAWLAERRD